MPVRLIAAVSDWVPVITTIGTVLTAAAGGVAWWVNSRNAEMKEALAAERARADRAERAEADAESEAHRVREDLAACQIAAARKEAEMIRALGLARARLAEAVQLMDSHHVDVPPALRAAAKETT